MMREFGVARQRRQAAGGVSRNHPPERRSTMTRTRSRPAAAASTRACKMRVEPLPRRGLRVRERNHAAARFPRNSFRPVEKGVVEALEGGILAGYPDGRCQGDAVRRQPITKSIRRKWRSRSAVPSASRKPAGKAKPVLLEPVMAVEVVVPEEYMGPVNGDLISRRGRIEGTEIRGHHAHHQGQRAAERNVRLCDRSAFAHAGPRQFHDALRASMKKCRNGLAEEIVSKVQGKTTR